MRFLRPPLAPFVDKWASLFDNLDMQISLVPPVQTAEQIVDKELLSYINTPKLERMSPCGLHVNNPLEWWAAHVSEFPLLSTLARTVLCIPATSAPTELQLSAYLAMLALRLLMIVQVYCPRMRKKLFSFAQLGGRWKSYVKERERKGRE